MTMWVLALAGCPGGGLPTAKLTLDGVTLNVEVAATSDQRAAGLMFRDALGANDGMVFVYPDDAPRSFWMKDTRVPLSIAYVDSTGTIVKISDMTPLSTAPVPSLYPARYAIEVNQGWFTANKVEVGDKVAGLKALPKAQ
jgi:uncharacterized membrane protein (UPF0127 family)